MFSEHPRAHLLGFHGILQADAYSGYAPLYLSEEIVEASCWAHARRKFYDLYVDDRSPIATEALQRIAALYAIEREIRGSVPSKRAMVRQERAGPLLAQLHAWLTTMLQRVSAKSEIAGAIRYALVRWTALTLYRGDGRIEIDNNSAERSIRPIVLGCRYFGFDIPTGFVKGFRKQRYILVGTLDAVKRRFGFVAHYTPFRPPAFAGGPT